MSGSNRRLGAFVLACFAGLPLTGMAQSPTKVAVPASPASASPAGTAASSAAGAQGSSLSLARPSDTIGAAADHQRTMRMLQSVPAKTGVAPGTAGDAKVPAIVVERMPDRSAQPGAQQGRPAEPPMVLTEVLKGPTKLMAGIELNGVNRFVSVGEDIGNGWRVAGVDKYRVILTMPEPTAKSAAHSTKAKSKGKDAHQDEPPKVRTLILPLGLRTIVAPANSTVTQSPGEARN